MSSLKLNNGITIPSIGFGTYKLPPSETEAAVASAIREGYRLIDTAQYYGNEAEVGAAIRKSGIPREQFFVITKLYSSGYKATQRAIAQSLKELNIGYIDLMLIHWPISDNLGTYKAMEDAYKAHQLRAIGVSNFYGKTLEHLLNNCTVTPALAQVEIHVFRQNKAYISDVQSKGIVPQAWSPLGCGKNNIFTNPILTEIAKEHGKTVAQVALRFLNQQGVVVIPKTSHVERLRENMNIEDFTLTPEDMQKIATLDKGKSLFGWY